MEKHVLENIGNISVNPPPRPPPDTKTSSVFSSKEIPAHIIQKSPQYATVSAKQHCDNRSLGRLYTRPLLSLTYSALVNEEDSPPLSYFQLRCSRATCKCVCVYFGTVAGRFGIRFAFLRRLRTVDSLTATPWTRLSSCCTSTPVRWWFHREVETTNWSSLWVVHLRRLVLVCRLKAPISCNLLYTLDTPKWFRCSWAPTVCGLLCCNKATNWAVSSDVYCSQYIY